MTQVYRWYQSGLRLKADVENSVIGSDHVMCWYIGQTGLIIKWQGQVIYIDDIS